jgi:hypothetical protein
MCRDLGGWEAQKGRPAPLEPKTGLEWATGQRSIEDRLAVDFHHASEGVVGQGIAVVKVEALSGRRSPLPKSRAKSRDKSGAFVLDWVSGIRC